MPVGVDVSKRLMLINVTSSIVAFALNATVMVWLQQYLLKRVSPDEYSLLPVLGSLIMFAPLLTNVLTGGLARYVTEAYAKGDNQRVTQIVSTMFPLLCAAGGAILILGGIVAWNIARIMTISPSQASDARIMMLLLVISFAIRLFTAPFSLGLFVRQRFLLDESINLGGGFFRAALLFALLFSLGPRVLWVAVANFIADLGTVAVSRIASIRSVPAQRFRVSHVHWPIARELVSFGGWTVIAQLAGTVRLTSDPIVLNKLSTSMDVTCFNLGSLPSYYLDMIFLRALGILQPALIAMHATSDVGRLRTSYLRIGRLSLWGVLCFVVPGVVFRNEVITFYVGSRYLEAATVMAILLLGLPLSYGNALAWPIAGARGQVRSLGVRAMLIQSGNLLVTLWLVGILHLGAVGPALGTLAATAVLQPILMWPLGFSVASTSFSQWFKETVVPGLAPAALSIPFFLAAQALAAPHSWFQLSWCVLVGEAVYFGSLVLFCLSAADRADLTEALRHARGLLGV